MNIVRRSAPAALAPALEWDPFRAMREMMNWDPFREMSPILAQEKAHRACLVAGHADCRFALHAADAVTPTLIAALVALGVLALIPVVVKRLRARSH